MSLDAVWIPLSIDWWMSPMFDDSADGARLAWVMLLCHTKANGRAGRAKVRAKLFARTYGLSERSVLEMLKTAREHNAITTDGDAVTICNWKAYNDKGEAAKRRRSDAAGKTSVSSLPSPSPSTMEQAPAQDPPKPPQGGKRPRKKTPAFDPLTTDIPMGLDTPEFREAWTAWCDDRRDRKIPLTKQAAKMHLSECAKLPIDEAIALIHEGINRRWQGLKAKWLTKEPQPDPDDTPKHRAEIEAVFAKGHIS